VRFTASHWPRRSLDLTGLIKYEKFHVWLIRMGLLSTSRTPLGYAHSSSRSVHLAYIAAVLLFLGMYAVWTGQFIPHPSQGSTAGQIGRKGLVTVTHTANQRGLPEVWAQGPNVSTSSPLLQMMDLKVVEELVALCGRGE
jgi:hypothetical protein